MLIYQAGGSIYGEGTVIMERETDSPMRKIIVLSTVVCGVVAAYLMYRRGESLPTIASNAITNPVGYMSVRFKRFDKCARLATVSAWALKVVPLKVCMRRCRRTRWVDMQGILVFCVAVAPLGIISWLKKRSDPPRVSTVPKQISYWPEPNRLELLLLSYKNWHALS
jgi:hypothetical protein